LLLLEDNPLTAEAVLEMLEESCVLVRREWRLETALQHLQRRRYDAILLDTELCRPERREGLARLREHAPVLLLAGDSGSAEEGPPEELLELSGAVDHLILRELSALLVRALGYAVSRKAWQREAELWRARCDRMAARGTLFASTISHEILNPMAGLLGFAHLLERTELDPRQREYVRAITSCTTSLSRMVADLLELSRIEAGQERVRRDRFDLAELAGEVGFFLAQGMPCPGVRLLVAVDPDLPPSVYGDAGKIRQLLYNLAHNGLKYTREGHVAIRLCRFCAAGSVVGVRLLVEDTGPGITAPGCHQLLERFRELGPCDRQDGHGQDGHGLGLSICARLARLLGSRLQIESQLGAGTQIWLDVELEPDGACCGWERPLLGRQALVLARYEPEQKVYAALLEGLGARVSCWPCQPAGPIALLLASEEDEESRELLLGWPHEVSARLLITRLDSPRRPGVVSLAAPLRWSQLLACTAELFPEAARLEVPAFEEEDGVCLRAGRVPGLPPWARRLTKPNLGNIGGIRLLPGSAQPWEEVPASET
jgi:signal transduction histidine kinase